MVHLCTLDGVCLQTLHTAFVEAFSDYQVKMDLPFWKFEQMLQRRGFCAELSAGAFEGERLVGFVLNGLRDWHGKQTAYDLGTGVVPEYRRQGITGNLLTLVKVDLQERQVEQYLLEVLTTNESALALYRKQGFKTEREFTCFRMDKDQLAAKAAWPVEMADQVDFHLVKAFWDFPPSWQNSVDSIQAVPEAFSYVVSRLNGDVAGYGIIDKRSGDIPQLAVSPAHRGKGVAASLLVQLAKCTEAKTLSVLNVQADSMPMMDFLVKAGFAFTVGQYEMLLKL